MICITGLARVMQKAIEGKRLYSFNGEDTILLSNSIPILEQKNVAANLATKMNSQINVQFNNHLGDIFYVVPSETGEGFGVKVMPSQSQADMINEKNTVEDLPTYEEEMEFGVKTLSAISEFLDEAGVEQRMVSEFIGEDGNVIENAIAAANFMQGTVDIIDEMEKRPAAWNKLPEEAAHWWYRLLVKDSVLKNALWESAKTSEKLQELLENQYGEQFNPEELGSYVLDMFREESIGQLIAEAIKKVEEKNASEEDYSFLKQFVEWINKMLDAFGITTEQDPFEIAAMKILSSDMSDLLTYEEYKELSDVAYFTDVVAEQKFEFARKLDKYPLLTKYANITEELDNNGNTVYKIEPNESGVYFWLPDNQRFKSLFLAEDFLSRQAGVQMTYDKEKASAKGKQLEEDREVIGVLTPTEYYEKLVSGKFRKRSKFLKSTIEKIFNSSLRIYTRRAKQDDLKPMNVNTNKTDYILKLTKDEKNQLIRHNDYTTFTPTLRALPVMLQKYKKNAISLSDPIRLDNVSKKDLDIIQNVMTLIKEENPTTRTISAIDLANEVHNFLELNYALGFANELKHLNYRVDSTFDSLVPDNSNEPSMADLEMEEILKLPDEEKERILKLKDLTKQSPRVLHNKVSLRFNDKFFNGVSPRPHWNYDPSARGNLTYFYSKDKKIKDAVLLHEIQTDAIENILKIMSQLTNLDEDKDFENYYNELTATYNRLITNPFNGSLFDDFIDFSYEINKKDALKDLLLKSAVPEDQLYIFNAVQEALHNFSTHPYTEERENQIKHESYESLMQGLLMIRETKSSEEEALKSIELTNYSISEAYQKIRQINDVLDRGFYNLLDENTKALYDNLQTELLSEKLSPEDANNFFGGRLASLFDSLKDSIKDSYGDIFKGLNPIINFKIKPRTNYQEVNTSLKFTITNKLRNNIDELYTTIDTLKKTKLSQIKSYREIKNIDNALSLSYSQFEELYNNFKNNVNLYEKEYDRINNINLQKIIILAKPTEIQNSEEFLSKTDINKYIPFVINQHELWTFINNFPNFKLKERNINPITKFEDTTYKKNLEKAKKVGSTEFEITAIKDSKGNKIGRKPVNRSEALFEISAVGGSKKIKIGLFKYSDIIVEQSKKLEKVKQISHPDLNEFKEAILEIGSSWNKVTLYTNEDYPDDYLIKSPYSKRIYSLNKNEYETQLSRNLKDLSDLNEKEKLTEIYNKYLEDGKRRYEQEKERIREKTPALVKDFTISKDYFLPLVTHLIMKHIKQAGKNVPMYFSGFEITSLSQGSYQTALIYAGPEEVNKLVDINNFNHRGVNYSTFENKFLANDQEISEKEYKKVHKEAVSDRAYEIKVEAAIDFGIDVSGSKEEVLKRISEFKKQSDYNAAAFSESLKRISGDKAIEIGVLYNLMSKVPGIKLIWQDKVEGIQYDTGGYLVDLSNFNYEAPILYSLAPKKAEAKQIKKGVDEVFEANPELVLIGTAQEYSDYLDTIFPDSKVKDIVYHGTNKTFDKFKVDKNTYVYYFTDTISKALGYGEHRKESEIAFHLNEFKNKYKFHITQTSEGFVAFGDNRSYKLKDKTFDNIDDATKYIDEFINSTDLKDEYNNIKAQGKSNIISALLNIKSPLFKDNIFYESKPENNDSIIGKDAGKGGNLGKTYVVFEPEQIHILGGEEDMKMFQEYMDFKNNVKDYFNLNSEQANFVQDISNLNINC